jgi:hypothetical protein
LKKKTKPETHRVPIGLFCKLKRPNLWVGFNCRVEGYGDGYHIVRVFKMDDSPSFQAAARFEELELT